MRERLFDPKRYAFSERVVLVSGSREWVDRPLLYATLDELRPTFVVHGNCRGADLMAEDWAKRAKVMYASVPYASWAGSGGGPLRNHAMLDVFGGNQPTCATFPLPIGSGTQGFIKMARAFGFRVVVKGPLEGHL